MKRKRKTPKNAAAKIQTPSVLFGVMKSSTATFVKGRGCNYCSKKGYRGRLGIYELMHVNSKIREMIFKQMSSTEIRKVAIEQGMRTLYNDGLWKTIRGITTLDEVYKNAKRTEQDVDV